MIIIQSMSVTLPTCISQLLTSNNLWPELGCGFYGGHFLLFRTIETTTFEFELHGKIKSSIVLSTQS
jgi:hypothetical protein